MEFHEFCTRIREDLEERLKEQGIETERSGISRVVKNNGHSLTALMIQRKGVNLSPTIYLEPYYDRYVNGLLYEDVLAETERMYVWNVPNQDFDVSGIMNFDTAKENIIYTLVNYERNKEFLKMVPHKRTEDLALIYKILLPQETPYADMATITIKNDLFEIYDVSAEELHEAAEENMKKLLPGTIRHISDVIGGFDLPGAETLELYVVSNEKQTCGASGILQPEVMDELAEKLGDNFYVIPSSTHEVLAVPEYMGDANFFVEMIGAVNEGELLPEEILGDKPYIVDAQEHKLILAERKEEYFKKKELQKQKQEEIKEESREEEMTLNRKEPKL